MFKINWFRIIGGISLIFAISLAIIAYSNVSIEMELPLEQLRLFLFTGVAVFGFLPSLSILGIVFSSHQYFIENGQPQFPIYLDVNVPVPEKILPIINELKNLGFTQLGVKANQDKNPKYHWVWVDESKTIIANIIESPLGKPEVSFETEYSDEFYFVTLYKKRFYINKPDMMISYLNSTIRETYDFHKYSHDEQSSIHGDAKIYNTLYVKLKI